MNYKIKWTDEKADAAIKVITKYFEKYGPGECIMQNDDALIYASDYLAEIVDDILIEGEGINYIDEDE